MTEVICFWGHKILVYVVHLKSGEYGILEVVGLLWYLLIVIARDETVLIDGLGGELISHHNEEGKLYELPKAYWVVGPNVKFAEVLVVHECLWEPLELVVGLVGIRPPHHFEYATPHTKKVENYSILNFWFSHLSSIHGSIFKQNRIFSSFIALLCMLRLTKLNEPLVLIGKVSYFNLFISRHKDVFQSQVTMCKSLFVELI